MSRPDLRRRSGTVARAFFAAACLWALPAPAVADDAAPPPADLLTVAESSDYTRTMRHAEVVTLCERLAERSDRIRLDSLGTSHEGRDLPMLVVADPMVHSAEEARRDAREVVLIFANIHAGEVCGKEALLMLAREYALAEERPAALDELIIVLVPNLNADGNERMAPDNRPGQVGPEEMGTRHNAQDLDLNRDWVKLDAPETRAIVRFKREWDPLVVGDSHTTDGSRHDYLITFQGPKHPAGDAELTERVRRDLLPSISERFTRYSDEAAFFYGNFASNHTRWTTYPADPRYGAAYRGLRNRIGILIEAYAYAPFRDRVHGTLEYCRAIIDETAEQHVELRRLARAADRRVAALEPGTPLPLRVEARALPGTVELKGYTEPEGRRGPIGEPTIHEVAVENDFVPTLSTTRPYGYLIPAAHAELAEHLVLHGVEVRRLRESVELAVESRRLDRFDRSRRPIMGRTRVSVEAGPPISRRHMASPGDLLVRCDQPLGTLAAYMLEPMATDGLAAWGFVDAEAGDRWPVLRLAEDMPLTTIRFDDEAHADDRIADATPRKRLTWEHVYADGARRPNLSGSAARPGRWIDAEHYTQTRGGSRVKVHAASGRATAIESMSGVAAERLARHAAIDERDARRIARSPWANGMPERPVVFTHAGDVWVSSPDAETVRRLTSSPESEGLVALAPGDAWVAFVRDDDIWAVPTDGGPERRLTTGGGDGIRHGRASWVYFEELFGRNWRAFWWSPAGDRLVLLRTDETPVPIHTLVDHRGRNRAEQRIESERYPRPGDRNPHVTVHVATAAGGPLVNIDLSDYAEGDHIVSHVSWVDGGDALHLHVQDRAQTWLDVVRANPRNGATTTLFRDRTDAWISSPGAPRELEDGGFLYQSERDGWNHVYHYDRNGRLVAQVTRGEMEVSSIAHVDEVEGRILFTASVPGPVRTYLFMARLDGEGDPVRLTTEPGSHRVSVSPDGRHFTDSWSNLEQPTQVALRDATGALVRVIDDNPVPALADWELADVTHHRIETPDGVTLDAHLYLPPDFDPEKTYPAWFMTYGGPQAPSVREGWHGGRSWEHVLAASGIVVFRADPYPASGQGAQSAWTAYKQLGKREIADIEHLIGWLTEHEWIDADRIGLQGHSYGGFITAAAMTWTELFRSGISGAPVTDWRLYDTVYTERYMGTLQENPEGYANTNVVASAADLHGTMLLSWGDLDDNVHPTNAHRLFDAMVRANVDVRPLMYPGRRHGFGSDHYRSTQYRFILETLEPEPVAATEPLEPSSESSPGGVPVDSSATSAAAIRSP